MTFPLGEWIDRHRSLPHDLGSSGMRGQLWSVPAAPSREGPSDPEELRTRLARLSGVASERLFLTSGATVGNTLALAFLGREVTRRSGRPPRLRVDLPEYPPLLDSALELGYQEAGRGQPADVGILSNPSNPRGVALSAQELHRFRDQCPSLIIDETFREFTEAPSIQRSRIPGAWSTGTFTKTYGADPIRVGWVIPPEESATPFRQFHGLLLDELPPHSVAWALAVLRRRRRILAEVRSIFEPNVRALDRAIPGVPRLAGPVWFDRGGRGLEGDRLARAAVRAGVLVCPGSFFGDPSGVRLSLTRRTFPEDLRAYLSVRRRFVPD